jgi:hypothetical protein
MDSELDTDKQFASQEEEIKYWKELAIEYKARCVQSRYLFCVQVVNYFAL